MTRNNLTLIIVLAVLLVSLTVIKMVRATSTSDTLPIVLYLPVPHPYFDEVAVGGRAFAAQTGIKVRVMYGQEAVQANVTSNVESLFAVGHRAFALYPVDPAGTRGLVERLGRNACHLVGYGAQPEAGTKMPFAIATDTRAAATVATQTLIAAMGGRGRILNVLEGMTDANTPIRQAAIEAVVAQHPHRGVGVRL